jgi:dTDP-4-dehydrorhamnose reductase
MNILLTGATGLLGRAVYNRLNPSENLCATAFSRAMPPIEKLDLRDANAVYERIEKFAPKLIVHTAAERRPDVCENDHAATDSLNEDAVKTLAAAAVAVGATLLYISTDYVFDGSCPPYDVDATPHPLNYYGKSKLAGEQAALASGAPVCILRVPILYGSVEALGESPVTLITNMVLDPREQTVDHWAVRYPTHVDDVATAIHGLAGLLDQGFVLPRRLHFSGSEAMTKYDMARIIASECGLSSAHLHPDLQPPSGAPRPQNSQLDTSLIESLVPLRRQSFAQVIGALIKPHLNSQ